MLWKVRYWVVSDTSKRRMMTDIVQADNIEGAMGAILEGTLGRVEFWSVTRSNFYLRQPGQTWSLQIE